MRGLVSALGPWTSELPLVTVGNPGANVRPAPFGLAHHGNTTSGSMWTRTIPQPFGAAATILHFGNLTPGDALNIAAGLGTNGAGSQCFIFQAGQSGFGPVRATLRTVNGGATSTAEFDGLTAQGTGFDNDEVLVAVYDGTGSIKAYRNGVLQTAGNASTGASGACDFNNHSLGGLNRGTDAFTKDGTRSYLSMAWNRALAAPEAFRISERLRRSAGMLLEPERRIWMPGFVAGGSPVSVDYAPGLETDAAFALAAQLSAAFGLAAEADAAFAPVAQLSTAFRVAAEVDAALAPTAALRPSYSVASEVDRAIAPAASLRASYGVAVELDAALSLQVAGVNTYGAAQEVENAYALSAQLRTSYGAATEVDRALSLSTVAGYAYGTAVELDAALAVSARLVAQYGMAVELDQALALAIAGDAPTIPPQRRLIAIPGGSTAFYVPAERRDFSALDF